MANIILRDAAGAYKALATSRGGGGRNRCGLARYARRGAYLLASGEDAQSIIMTAARRWALGGPAGYKKRP